MGWFSKKTEKRSLVDGDGHVSWLALQGFTTVGRNAEAVTAVTACIRIIADTLAILKPTIKDTDGNDIQQHTLSPLLRSPSRDLSWGAWLSLMVTEYLIRGNAIAVMDTMNGRLQLTFIPWTYVNYYSGDRYYVQIPSYPDMSGEKKTYMESDVLHWRAITGSRDGGFTGRSALQRCADAVNLAGTLDKAVESYFANGCAPSGIFSVKQKLTPDQLNQLQTSFSNEYAGSAKQGKPMLLHGDATYQQVGNHAHDSQLVEQRRFQISEIARIFGVPLAFLASDLNTTTYASAYEQRMALLMSLQGYIAAFTSAFNVKFLNEGEELVLDESMLLQDLQPATTPQENMQGVQ